ncbi:hypothetical protein ACQEVF_18145 [Nonomuraea polychroma]|uniref:hypothetical protein n=1 Tax=Nonomuraea polychroma TaxID=46176 RepID=UPI003D8BB6DE
MDREVIETLVRMETKLDAAISRGDDHEDRIRRLERAVWVAAGAGMAGGGVFGVIVQGVTGS